MSSKGCVATDPRDCRASRRCVDDRECYLNADDESCDDGTERWSAGMMAAGIVLSSMGGAGIASGVFMVVASPFVAINDAVEGTDNASGLLRAGGIIAAVGLGVGLSGIPLAMVGGRGEPREPRDILTPTVSLGPTGGSLTWQW
ncbi:MAG: hypothetical protein JRI23_29875 [Deltaproteobacteria bacterium]|nr:hypothetical protein [Deltaproteobacteria bacterium]MBW2536360.1 hypothetical protein [Deltaproteobacteria bacterium]